MANFITIGRQLLEYKPHTFEYSGQACRSIRTDSTYPTVQSGNISCTTVDSTQGFGKSSNTGNIGRQRAGFSFPGNAAIVDKKYKLPTSAVLKVTIASYSNSLDPTWAPAVYLSNSDDHSLYSTSTKSVWDWETHLDNYLGTLTYGTTTEQTISIPIATFLSLCATNTYLSFIFGQNLEMTNSGTGTPSGITNSLFSFQDDANPGFAPVKVYLYVS